jgi:uncharacterized protein (TIRG00374 family)
LALVILTSLALAGILLFLADLREVRSILNQADWTEIPLVLFFTATSYIAISYSFARLGKLIGLRTDLPKLASVGFASAALNRVVSGFAGIYLRHEVLKREGADLGQVLILSALHSYLTSLVMMITFPIGLLHLLRNSPAGRDGALAVGIAWVLIMFVLLSATGLLISGRLRTWLLGLAGTRAGALLPQSGHLLLRNFETTLTRSIELLRSRPAEMAIIAALIVIDVAASATALWLALAALGPAVSALDLVTGFVIGTVAGGIVGIAGGLGVQEISLVGIFSYLGATLEHATLASILYRILYFFVPFIISIGSYFRLIRRIPTPDTGAPQYAHSDA